jgi:hypothetical protein
VPQSFLIALYRISHNRHVDSTTTYNLAVVVDRRMDGETPEAGARRTSNWVNRPAGAIDGAATPVFVAPQPHRFAGVEP